MLLMTVEEEMVRKIPYTKIQRAVHEVCVCMGADHEHFKHGALLSDLFFGLKSYYGILYGTCSVSSLIICKYRRYFLTLSRVHEFCTYFIYAHHFYGSIESTQIQHMQQHAHRHKFCLAGTYIHCKCMEDLVVK